MMPVSYYRSNSFCLHTILVYEIKAQIYFSITANVNACIYLISLNQSKAIKDAETKCCSNDRSSENNGPPDVSDFIDSLGHGGPIVGSRKRYVWHRGFHKLTQRLPSLSNIEQKQSVLGNIGLDFFQPPREELF